MLSTPAREEGSAGKVRAESEAPSSDPNANVMVWPRVLGRHLGLWEPVCSFLSS